VPRLLFKRNQLEPEISRKLVTGFSRHRYIGPMLSNAARSAIGHPIMLILMLPFCALASPHRGTLRFCTAPAWLPRWRSLATGGSVRPYGVSTTFPMFFAVLNKMMAAPASSKGKVRMICRMASPEHELLVAAINARAQNASIELTFLAVTASRPRSPPDRRA
jgi:hypothetical protein